MPRSSSRGLLFSLLLVACTSDEAIIRGARVRDSAGVRIVESRRAAWNADEAWRVGSSPLVDFGPSDDLHGVPAAYRLDDGRIVVAHAGGPEFLVYSRDGRLLERHGRRGSGPGEFGELTRVRRGAGDSIVVHDYPNFRIVVLAPDGGFGRHRPVPRLPDGTPILIEDVFGDGSLLATPLGGPPSGQGMTRRERTLWRIADDTDAGTTQVATFPEQELYFFEHLPRPVAFRRPWFGRTAYYVAGSDRLFWSTTDTLQIRVHGLDGRLLALFRRDIEPRAFGPADVEALIEQSLAEHRDPAARPALRRVLEEMPTSGVVPAFGWPDHGATYGRSLLADDAGNLWVAEYYMPGEERNARAVFDTGGVWMGTVELPLRFSPTHIGEDFILGVWRDDDDVEHVRLYALEKPHL